MNRTAIIAALVAAAVGVGLLLLYMKRFEEEKSGGAPVRVLMARTNIPLGAQITEAMLAERELPSSYVEERHIRAEDAERIKGIRVSMGVNANSSILWSDLATTSEERRDLAGIVRSGMRAVTIRAAETAAFGGLLRPGDRVDVIWTTNKPGREQATRAIDDKVTFPLMQNVMVLAIGRDLGSRLGEDGQRQEAQRTREVTVLVRLDQAQTLMFAGESGRLALALRNPDDIALIDSVAETTGSDLFEPEKRAAALRRERPTPPPTPAPMIPQEIVRGN